MMMTTTDQDGELQFLIDLRHAYLHERDDAQAAIAERNAANDATGIRIAQHRLTLACKALDYVHDHLESIRWPNIFAKKGEK